MSTSFVKWLVAAGALISIANCASTHDQIYEGQYVWGAEVDTFRPCGSQTVYWASYNWAGSELKEYYQAVVKEPYTPIYVRFRGHVLDEEVDGFALDYDGLIHISEVLDRATNVPSSCS